MMARHGSAAILVDVASLQQLRPTIRPVGHALDLERQKHSIEGIIGPNGETFDRHAYAELRRKMLNGK
jgi:hypothetical protein